MTTNPEIIVEYDGKYPCACMGTLTIKLDNETIYSEQYVCGSDGVCGFNDDYTEEYIEEGELTWREFEVQKFRDWFDKQCRWMPSVLVLIEKAVKDKLSHTIVCCGGCL